MKKFRQKSIFTCLIVISLFILPVSGWATIDLPHAFFDGLMVTYTDNPEGDDLIFVSTKINSVFYSDGSSSTTDVIVGKDVIIQGAQRDCTDSPCTTFTDATISISGDGITYFTATLSDITFVTDGMLWFLNPELDVNDPQTLNLTDIELYPNGSDYIQDLKDSIGSKTLAGMQMRLFNIDGDITGDSTNVILEGLIDGVQGNSSPKANAGDNIAISSEMAPDTVIQGTAYDEDDDSMQYRWTEGKEGGNVLMDWTAAGANGECPLDLGTLLIGIGTYTLNLEVDDGQSISTDDMFLTIENSAPHAGPGGGGTYEIGTEVILPADVSDYDGDPLYYEWSEGTTVLCSSSGYDIQTIEGGYGVMLPDCTVTGLDLGTHVITLTVDDGINTDSNSINVIVDDTTAPTLIPAAERYLLWPPNHVMADIEIAANAADNSGMPVTLSAEVSSDEPEYGLGDGDTGPDFYSPEIDQVNGMIYLQLRRERSGAGDGRTYTILITAEDNSGNTSTASVNIGVPHDKRKK